MKSLFESNSENEITDVKSCKLPPLILLRKKGVFFSRTRQEVTAILVDVIGEQGLIKKKGRFSVY